MKIYRKLSTIIVLLCVQAMFSVNATELQQLGDQAFKSGDYQKANSLYRRALREDKGNAEILLGIAKSEEVNGNIKQAKKFAKKAIKKDSQLVDAYLVLGRMFGRQEKWQKARHVYQAATVIDPQNEFAALGLGEALGRLGEQDKASSEFERFKALKAQKKNEQKD